MLTSVVHINPITTIHRRRLLPIPGKLLVRKGQKVCATDVIAEAEMSTEHYIFDLGRGLGIPAEKVARYIQCKVGMDINPGDLLAGPVGFTKRVVRSPYSGRVVFIDDGQVLLRLHSQPYQLYAGINGTISELIDERGAIITTTGALIQGVWGNQEIDTGLLHVLTKTPGDSLSADRLDISLRGSILFGGHCSQQSVLRTAVDLSLRGLILGSIDSTLLPYARSIKIPVIVLEGFGKISINSTAYKLLTTNEGREVLLNAEAYDRFSGKRPEIVIPLPAPDGLAPPKENIHIEVGQNVRIIRAPYAGKIGKINTTYSDLFSLPNGIKTEACEIRLENGENVPIPVENFEVIE